MTNAHPMQHPYYGAIKVVATAVLESEKHVDDCILSTAALLTTTLTTVEDNKLPRQLAQPAIDRLGVAFESLITTRREIIAAHIEYGKVAHGLGAPPEAFGDFWPCPPASRRKQGLQVAA